ncbi:MAG: hypothetical protein LPD71_05860 [Shewanella sp.]|nr:hypothetical protein [Shewanella sp.]MCF1459607.1 hypothetical protein [Shewanella sp.]
MEVSDFWSTMDMVLVAEIIAVMVTAFGLGWAAGYQFYMFRRITSSI